jgi:hypothetical protein
MPFAYEKQALAELGKSREQYFTLEQKSGILKIPAKKILAFSSDRRKIILSMNDGSSLDFMGNWIP